MACGACEDACRARRRVANLDQLPTRRAKHRPREIRRYLDRDLGRQRLPGVGPAVFDRVAQGAAVERLEAELMRLQSEASHASHSASRLQQKLLADFGKTKYTWRMAHFSHMSDPVVATSQDLIPPQKAASLKTTTLRSRGSIARSVGSPLGGKKKERTSFTSFRSFRDFF